MTFQWEILTMQRWEICSRYVAFDASKYFFWINPFHRDFVWLKLTHANKRELHGNSHEKRLFHSFFSVRVSKLKPKICCYVAKAIRNVTDLKFCRWCHSLIFIELYDPFSYLYTHALFSLDILLLRPKVERLLRW